MSQIFNRHSEKAKRQRLRSRIPKAEIILWSRLRRRQLAGAKFRRQYGVYQFVLDFYCPELKLAIEVDGPTHNGPEAQRYDRWRQNMIEHLGVQFLRFTNRQVYQQLDTVLNVIYQKVLELRQREKRTEDNRN